PEGHREPAREVGGRAGRYRDPAPDIEGPGGEMPEPGPRRPIGPAQNASGTTAIPLLSHHDATMVFAASRRNRTCPGITPPRGYAAVITETLSADSSTSMIEYWASLKPTLTIRCPSPSIPTGPSAIAPASVTSAIVGMPLPSQSRTVMRERAKSLAAPIPDPRSQRMRRGSVPTSSPTSVIAGSAPVRSLWKTFPGPSFIAATATTSSGGVKAPAGAPPATALFSIPAPE